MAEPLREPEERRAADDLEAREEGEPAPQDTVHTSDRPEGRAWTWGSFALAVLGVFLAPLIGGAFGMAAGWIAHRKGDPRARWAISLSAAVFLLGVIFAIVFLVG